MVFGVDPEDGHRGDAMLGAEAFHELDRGERLEQREQRAAEQSRLLAGDDGDRLRIAQPCRRLDGLRRRAAPLLLGANDVGDRVARACLRAGTRDRLAPGARLARIAREEVGDSRVIERVIGHERPDPREPADVDGNVRGGGHAGDH